MSEPSADGAHGSLVCAGETDEARQLELGTMVEVLHRRRLQVQVHATGDRACAAVVEALVRAGVHVVDSSDAPLVDPDWRRGLQYLVSRGEGQSLSRVEALRAWTIEPAYQDGLEHEKGSIEEGKLADCVVVAEDLLAVDNDQLHAVTPVMTILGGAVAHEA